MKKLKSYYVKPAKTFFYWGWTIPKEHYEDIKKHFALSRTQKKSVSESADKLIPARGFQSPGQNLSRVDRSGAISPAEDAILGRAQAKISNQSIRAEINSDNKTISDTDKKLIEKIIFWQGTNKPGGVLDPEKESERIKGLKSDGKPISNSAVPVIERADRGLLDGLF